MPVSNPARRTTLAVALLSLVATAAVGLSQPSSAQAVFAAPASTAVSHPAADRMGSTIAAHSPAAPAAGQLSSADATTGSVYGMDVSSYQANVDWSSAAGHGATFAYVKATESTGYVNPYFGQQYNGAAGAGLVRGAYHFALPNNSSGATQANYFVSHGGGWSNDGRTLPPLLDIEYNPYGPICYGLTSAQMSTWVREFSNTVQGRTGRYPMIYSTADWWNTCTGRDASFAATNPLFIARYSASPGTLPAGWLVYTIWQYADHGQFPGDADVFNGSLAQLRQFAGAAVGGGSDQLSVRYRQLGGASSLLGAPLGDEYRIPGGLGQDFQGGRLYYTQATGVHLVRGSILVNYLSHGGPAGPIGVPVTDEMTTPGGAGRFNHFSGSGASIYWSPATGAHEVQGSIRARWESYGWEQGPLGYPVTDELTTPDGAGRFNHFSGSGASIYWSPSTGAQEVQGSIRARWSALGWERGPLGYPVSNEYQVAGGRRSDFQRGSIVFIAATGGIQVL